MKGSPLNHPAAETREGAATEWVEVVAPAVLDSDWQLLGGRRPRLL